MIGRDANVRRAGLDHLRNCAKNTKHCAERRITLAETPNAVKLAKQLVGAIDKVNDHAMKLLRIRDSRLG